MKQLTDEQIEEMARQEQLLLVCDDLEALTEIVRATERALAALDTAQPDQVNAMLVEALEEARNGLAWYQAMYPAATDGSDDEAMERIDAALAAAEHGASNA